MSCYHRKVGLPCAFLFLFLFVPQVLADEIVLVSSTFDTDQDGWRVITERTGDLFTPIHVPTGGNPGGHIRMNDPGELPGTRNTWYWFAPEQFLGNMSAAFGGQLRFDLQATPNTNLFPNVDVALIGGAGQVINAYFFPINPLPPSAAPNWTSYSVNLTAAGWQFGIGTPLTDAQMMDVLGNLREVWIRGEFQIGPDEGGLDNVRITAAVPEPTTLLLLGTGLAGVAASVRRRRKSGKGKVT